VFFVVVWFVVISNYSVRSPLAFSSCIFWYLELSLSWATICYQKTAAHCWITKSTVLTLIGYASTIWYCWMHIRVTALLNQLSDDHFQSVLHWWHFMSKEVLKIVCIKLPAAFRIGWESCFDMPEQQLAISAQCMVTQRWKLIVTHYRAIYMRNAYLCYFWSKPYLALQLGCWSSWLEKVKSSSLIQVIDS